MTDSTKIKMIVNICTCKRPVMLKECLESVMQQQLPDDWSLEIQVIDNDPSSQLEQDILYWTATSNFKVRYTKETKRGIPFARNTACELAIKYQADWIVFIDDDEVALPNWLTAFALATKSYKAEAFTGPVQYIFPGKTAKWLSNPNDQNTQDGAIKKRASTNNVMISKSVIAPNARNMRFDEQMALMGGSDTDFFMRLVHQQGEIRFVKQAIVSEKVLPNRTTIVWRLKRQFRSSSNRIYIHKKLYGASTTFTMACGECFRHLLDGTISMLFTPFFLVNGWLACKKRFYHSLRHYAKGAGNIAGLINFHLQPYKKIDGF